MKALIGNTYGSMVSFLYWEDPSGAIKGKRILHDNSHASATHRFSSMKEAYKELARGHNTVWLIDVPSVAVAEKFLGTADDEMDAKVNSVKQIDPGAL